jgi:chromosome segregation ATPase
MIKKSTYTRAYDACGHFFAETGQIPTIDTIKPIIGTNSPSTISTAIKDWKSSLSQTIGPDQRIISSTPDALTDAMSEVWKLAVSEANKSIKEKEDDLQSRELDLANKEANLYSESNRMKQLVYVTEQKYISEIDYLKKEINRLTAESSYLLEQTNQFRTLATSVEMKNAVLTEEIRHEKEKLIRLETQYEKEHDWSLKRINEEKDTYRQQIQNEMQRLQSEAYRNKLSAELLQAKLEIMTKQSNEKIIKIEELDKALSEERAKTDELLLNENKLKKEIIAKENKLRHPLKKASKKQHNKAQG